MLLTIYCLCDVLIRIIKSKQFSTATSFLIHKSNKMKTNTGSRTMGRSFNRVILDVHNITYK